MKTMSTTRTAVAAQTPTQAALMRVRRTPVDEAGD
jgi:hypothetical protein